MQLKHIDSGKAFDFGKTSKQYVQYRDIYPESMYEKLIQFGIGRAGQSILDLGSGTAILPMHLYHTGADFISTDISEKQVAAGKAMAEARGMNIQFKICSAENTGFSDRSFDVVTAVQCFQYFDPEKAAEEIRRILKPNGLFCKIFMDWLPKQDEKIAEMEQLVLKYNPEWSGNGFEKFRYHYPEWAEERFDIETIHSYNAVLTFEKEAWLERVKTCRGIGASLPKQEIQAFEEEYRTRLTEEILQLKHQIHIEIYRVIK